MIITTIKGGLGNQFFQYAIGRALSINRNTMLFADRLWFQGNIHRRYKLNYFEIRIFTLPYLISKVLLSKKYWVHFVNHNILKFKEIKETSWRLNQNIFEGNKNIYLDGFWVFNIYYCKIREQLEKEFTLKKKYKRKIERLLIKVQNENSVSIHIRRGDYLADENKNIFETLKIEYFYNAIEMIKEKIDNPIFYFFSDDTEWLKRNFKFGCFVNSYTGNADYLDFEVMKNCKHNIISNSTFSWWAAWLNRNKKKIVIVPKKWYKIDVAQDLYENKKILFIQNAIRI